MLHHSPPKKTNLRAGAQAPLTALRFGFLGGFDNIFVGPHKKKIEKKKIETLSISTGVKNSRKSDPVDIDRRKKLPLDDI